MLRKKFLAVLLSVVMVFCILPISSLAATAPYQTGLIWDDWDSLGKKSDSGSVNVVNLPKSVDLTNYFPTPGCQGSQSSCTAWAVGYALVSYQQNVLRGWTKNTESHLFSPSYIYNQLNGGVNAGSSIAESLDLVIKSGICTLTYFPYDEKDYTTQPTSLQKAAASLYKAQGWSQIEGIDSIKERLSNGDGVIIGVIADNDLFYLSATNPIYDKFTGEFELGHAVCLIGYDDDMQAFKFINSWGTDWGIDGYGWISYDLVSDPEVNHHGAACGYVLNKKMSDDYILGDVNEDGTVTSADARLALQYSSRTVTPTDRQFVLSDVDGNGKITAADARYILNYASKTIDKMPIYE